MKYVDGYVLAVPNANKDAYTKLALTMAALFKKNGAIKVVECWGDDVPEGKLTSFPMAVKCEANETVVFSWVIWPTREIRDKGMKMVMDDPYMQAGATDVPFDGKRMIFGGFQMIVDE
jgi:uncharacterized protein YbaA (DUF1428 family)